ncbi:hypothetical protein BN946_scf184999.g84 [Trametes cinnabarina]|uniref:Amidohydrolase 3 domain-containing protein n=1 Tax=Pycnoporus cinnabarinus TaxID=5643 RepID=A0A060SDG9_PYCCI|nr:hypothetical protein BN946_scf184999.g84 [Trametes cinnabarina]
MSTAKSSPQPRPSDRTNNSGNRQVVWTLVASAVAGLTAYYSSLSRPTPSVTALPSSYVICAEGQRIYTVDSASPTVDCILVEKHNIAASGTLGISNLMRETFQETLIPTPTAEVKAYWDDYQDELIRKFYGNEPSAKKPLPVYNAPTDSIIIPGLTDAHAHIVQYGFKMQLRLDQAQSLSEILDLLEDHVRSHPPSTDTWIEAMGWDQTRWSDNDDLASRPSLASLPIALHRVDVHALWLSPRAVALTKAHLNGTFPASVPGGEIVRDPATGEPTGIFVDAAMSLVPIPSWSASQMRDYAAQTVKDALAVGLTSIHDAATSLAEFELFQQMDEENKLPIRVYAMADADRLSPR